MRAIYTASLMAFTSAVMLTESDADMTDVPIKEYEVFLSKNFDLNGDGVISKEEL